MRTSRAVIFGAGSSALIVVGFASAPPPLAPLDLAVAQNSQDVVAPSPSATPCPSASPSASPMLGAFSSDSAQGRTPVAMVSLRDRLTYDKGGDDDDDRGEDDDEGDDDEGRSLPSPISELVPAGTGGSSAVTEEVVDDCGNVVQASVTTTVQVFVGNAEHNSEGYFQAQILVQDGVVVDVQFVQAGTGAAESVRANSTALPLLRERVLKSQDWNVAYVSGASYTSPAMVGSLKSAFGAAGL